MNIDQNENVAQKENDDHEKKKENVQPVQKQIDEFKSHYSQNFQTIHCLGKGGFGIVFKARNKLDDCNYAIKRIPFPPRCMDTSSNITTSPTDTTRDSHSERKATKQYLYIQMELCQKYSLRERLKTGTLHKNMMDILNIFFQIIEGVEYIHLQEFIHRDLKPSNIFFISDDQIKIGDFGSVTKMLIYDTWNEYDDKQKCLNEQHTNQVGTHLYMSPEQIHGKPYNLKVDIYSLGVIFFEMLNSFNTEMERCKTLQQVRNGTFPPQFLELYEFKTEKDMVCLMLSQDPKKRPTASNLKSMLLVYLDRFNLLMPDSCPF
ncbi:eukaryotic translation initiation factor 2-alpha kinase 3-like isoform X2 [Metopolophium dirhodum]|uniref:eukaryotic translation initiation factor 2-alpha kinase 3-like isoform X2 n=1 Tax=Metopolophium dirhodum TaxID=44670 RepID=UPI00298FD56D|nr:eukaryotic translation initiation factor 2-alpha kinase 3-like isoform X2 [Metopolophium dirhodum]